MDEFWTIGIVACSVFVLLLIGVIFIAIDQDEEHDEVCKQIGEKNKLTFLFQSKGRCGNGIACYYQCRFINSNGEQITKNVK